MTTQRSGRTTGGGKKLTPAQERAISERAYARYQARGGNHGYDLEDWLAAEAEVLAQGSTRRAKSASTGDGATSGSSSRAKTPRASAAEKAESKPPAKTPRSRTPKKS